MQIEIKFGSKWVNVTGNVRAGRAKLLATGGIIKPGVTYPIGERGPELTVHLNPDLDGRVIADALERQVRRYGTKKRGGDDGLANARAR